jgi:hypothetical protein
MKRTRRESDPQIPSPEIANYKFAGLAACPTRLCVAYKLQIEKAMKNKALRVDKAVSLPKMLSGANAFEISEVQEDETETVPTRR